MREKEGKTVRESHCKTEKERGKESRREIGRESHIESVCIVMCVCRMCGPGCRVTGPHLGQGEEFSPSTLDGALDLGSTPDTPLHTHHIPLHPEHSPLFTPTHTFYHASIHTHTTHHTNAMHPYLRTTHIPRLIPHTAHHITPYKPTHPHLPIHAHLDTLPCTRLLVAG